ncbi:MAG: class I SAM-dependent methyltransferase [Alphaproteobacteria bacterium]|nr:class I SAM-dependent methyltransferase [Alphaproteobacteria bacterium]MBU1514503.1 class I SAM-dependent methyltransferase [Alphaproteobacteria bacterium]MBU2096865.1 class I SAM-dependent methyltransferase [Alphaproteobacteria bacterium]MBU2153492.1 class I SAM-dependent methyltransferase [Alphaproteobacteria bacterium]MBU2306003.1 class I SAM-dependent methyltransferase [Alphaproteobacteria bacterium]
MNDEARGTERSRLHAIAADSTYGAGANGASIAHSFEVFSRHIRPGPILEMGPAEGIMTGGLATLGEPLTLVEGAAPFCESLKARFPQADVVNALFEEFQPGTQFQTIILGHVLEHVEDPVDILTRAKAWLAPGGRIMAAVPNARSVHRQAAVLMGLLPFEEALNDADRKHGHRRVYNPETFRRDFLEAGLSIEVFGGYWLKPLSNGQIERDWDDRMLTAFMALGERYPDIAGEIYVVANLDRAGRSS